MGGMSLGTAFAQRYRKAQGTPSPTEQLTQGPSQSQMSHSSGGMGGSRIIPGMNQQMPRGPGGFVPPGQTGGFVPPGTPQRGGSGGILPGAPNGTGLSQGGAYQRFQQGTGGAYTRPQGTPFGSTGAQGGYMAPNSGPGDRRYYDQGRNDLMARHDQGAAGLQAGYDQRSKDLSGMLEGYGNQELKDARQSGQNMISGLQQDATSRGLSGTTVRGANTAMGWSNMQNDLGRINERLQGQKVGLAERTTGDALGFGERAFQGGVGLGQQNLRDSRGDFESDRSFGEGQFQSDRNFGRGTYEDDRNFNRGTYEDDRNFGNRNFESDRDFGYQQNLDNRNLSFRDRNFDYQRYMDSLNRDDRLKLEQLGFMERRNDGYPDLGMLAQMMQGQGQYGLA